MTQEENVDWLLPTAGFDRYSMDQLLRKNVLRN
jgi:hypothetical protein